MVKGSVNCRCTRSLARRRAAAGQSLRQPKRSSPQAAPLPRGEAGWCRAALRDKCGAAPPRRAPVINPLAPAQGHPSAAVHKDCSRAQGLQPCTRTAAVHKACSHAQGLQPCVVIAAMHGDCRGAQRLQLRLSIAAVRGDCSHPCGPQKCTRIAAVHGDRSHARGSQKHRPSGGSWPHQSRRSSKAALTHAGIKQRAASPRSRTPHHAAGL